MRNNREGKLGQRADFVWPLFTAVFIASIFYGDVALGYVLPASMLLAPIVILFACKCHGIGGLTPPRGTFLLALMAVPVAAQFALGLGPTREDLGFYLPIAYGVIAACALARVQVDDRCVWLGIAVGALITTVVMLVMVFLVPPHVFLIPGQVPDAWLVPQANGSPAVVLSAAETAFYNMKNLARNALGRSNYIAVFLVFTFTAALFVRNWLTATLAFGAVLLTYSRTGLMCSVLALVLLAAHAYRIRMVSLVITGLVACAGIVLFLIVFPDSVPASVWVRLDLISMSFEPIREHWLFGAPRSVVAAHLGVDLTWSPHNSLASVAVTFGMIGLLFYGAYVWTAMSDFYHLGRDSRLWRGIFYGFVVTFIWSMVEIIVLTPAFEILFAALYAIGRNKRRLAGKAKVGKIAAGSFANRAVSEAGKA